MAKKKKDGWIAIVIGPGLVLASLTALWKNETRFDYAKAAAQTPVVESIAQAEEGGNLSHTGPMDQGLSFPGQYVATFTGYLVVWRSSEIYAWHENEDDDGTSWDLRWMGSLESNSRNSGVRQLLSDKTLMPKKYQVGELTAESDRMEFVDATINLSPSALVLSKNGQNLGLSPSSGYFYMRKSSSQSGGDSLGDERVSFTAIVVPEVATYFGRYKFGQGVADTRNQRTGWINLMIRDTGILHHLVIGDRKQALARMRFHISRLKWLVRGAGTAGVVLGFVFLFSFIVGFLFHIPYIGPLAKSGVWLVALVIGVPLAFLTIISSYLIAHPLLLVLLIAVVVAAIYMLRSRGGKKQAELKTQLDQEYGHELSDEEMKDLEFLELARLALSDASFGKQEEKVLKLWAKAHRWSDTKYKELLDRARSGQFGNQESESNEQHLKNLIRLAMADGDLSIFEVRTIRKVSRKIGYNENKINQMIRGVRHSLA